MKDMKIKMDNMQNPKDIKITSEKEKLEAWLCDEVRLEQYFEIFVENGFDTLEAMKMVTIDELNQIGIEKLGHKMIIMKHIVKLNNVNPEGVTAYI